MIEIFLVPGSVFVFFFLWIMAIKPNKITTERKKKIKPFQDTYIAHRGLFSNKYEGEDQPPNAPENSLAAFQKAVEQGYGIEMDVQLSKDGKLVVFHDGDLKRICGIKKKVIDCTYEELQKYSLLKSKERIPLFKEVMEVVQGKVPLLIEVKPDGNSRKTCQVLNEHLENYQGIYCMESFDPRAVRWYRKNRPDVIRGQLSERFKNNDGKHKKIVYFFLTCLALNFLGRPDFISYNHKHKEQISYRFLRKLFPVFNAAWTIRSQEQLENAKDVFTIFIFDSFIPQ